MLSRGPAAPRPQRSGCSGLASRVLTSYFSFTATSVANPVLSFLDVKRILFQKITAKGDELVKAFHLLDTGHTMTVSKSELRRLISTFLLPLTREQFHEVLAKVQSAWWSRAAGLRTAAPRLPCPASRAALGAGHGSLPHAPAVRGDRQGLRSCSACSAVASPSLSVVLGRLPVCGMSG